MTAAIRNDEAARMPMSRGEAVEEGREFMGLGATLVAFSTGDARDASTWSNVPYMFLSALDRVRPDIRIKTCNIHLEESMPLVSFFSSRVWNRFLTPRLGALCTFDRTRLYRLLVLRRMRAAERDLAGGGTLLTFDFSNPAPCVEGCRTCLLCDWTIGYEIVEHQHRAPTPSEERLMARQQEAISSADVVISLFPRSARLIAEGCPDADVRYLELPANVYGEVEPNFNRSDSRRLLFVGKPAYAESLRTVTAGLEAYNGSHPDARLGLDVIGMDSLEGVGGDGIKFHGFLHKDVTTERDLYYGLMRSARALVTVSDRWVGASSIVEAMALGTPVIVSPNPELEEMLGAPDFGWWCGCSAKEVEGALGSLMGLGDDALADMCRTAEARVHNHTWDNFVRSWCEIIGL